MMRRVAAALAVVAALAADAAAADGPTDGSAGEDPAALVAALSGGDAAAGQRLIALARWDDLGSIDPRPFAAWSDDGTRIGACTRRQVYAEWHANWAVRHRDLVAPGAGRIDADLAIFHALSRCAFLVTRDPLREPMLFPELLWLVHASVQAPLDLERLAARRLAAGIDGADAAVCAARLDALARLVVDEYLADDVDDDLVGAEAAAARRELPAQQLAIIEARVFGSWRRWHGDEPPPLTERTPPGDDRLDEREALALRSGDPRLIARVEGERCDHGIAAAEAAADAPTADAAWTHAAAAAQTGLDAARQARDDDAAARLLVRLAWCRHRGIARDAVAIDEAKRLYDEAAAAARAHLERYPHAYDYCESPLLVALADGAWLGGDPPEAANGLPFGTVLPLPATDIANRFVLIPHHRVGPQARDRGVGDEDGWYVVDGERRHAFHGAWRGGRPDGAWSLWHRSGALAAVGAFAHGRPVGRWRFFHEDGSLECEVDADQPRFTGVVAHLDPDGSVRSEERWFEGSRDRGGPPAPREAAVRDGHRIERDGDGRVTAEGDVVDGVGDGEWTWYRADGSVHERATLRLGVIDGRRTRWRADGSMECEEELAMGVRDGVSRWYHENGRVSDESAWAFGEEVGDHRSWYEDGAPKAHDRWVDGRMAHHEAWYPSGRLEEVEEFGATEDDHRWSVFGEEGQPMPMHRLDGTPIPPVEEHPVR